MEYKKCAYCVYNPFDKHHKFCFLKTKEKGTPVTAKCRCKDFKVGRLNIFSGEVFDD